MVGRSGTVEQRFQRYRELANSVAAFDAPAQTSGGEKFSLIDLMDTHRIRLSSLPALSFVPEARAPPKGCWPTTAPVDLPLM